MNTHDIGIELPPLPTPEWYLAMSVNGDQCSAELRVTDADAVNAALDMAGIVEIQRLITVENAVAYARTAIGADRQRRGEPVAWRWSESNGERWFGWTTDWSHHDRAAEMGCLIEYAAPEPKERT